MSYLGILDDEAPIIPANLATCLAPQGAETAWDVTAFGDFVVCPFTKARLGEMQGVCFESARNIIVEHSDDVARRCILHIPAPSGPHS